MKKNLKTILAIVLGLLFFYFIFNLKLLLIIAAIIGWAGLLSDFLAQKIAWTWLKFTEALGNVISKIILSLVFFIVLFPLAILYRRFNKDPLNLKKSSSNSYYNNRHNHQFISKDLELPF